MRGTPWAQPCRTLDREDAEYVPYRTKEFSGRSSTGRWMDQKVGFTCGENTLFGKDLSDQRR